MVELRMGMKELRGDGKSSWESGTWNMLCASQSTIAYMAGTTPDPAGNNSTRRTYWPNQVHRTADFSYPFISYISFTTSSPISLSFPQLYYYCRIESWAIPLYLSILWLWVNTKNSMQWVKHTPSTTASTNDCWPAHHHYYYHVTPECRCSFWLTSPPDWLPPASSPLELNGTATTSHSHCCK